jgi:D-sedoheptulose 7-phosphate isomerase
MSPPALDARALVEQTLREAVSVTNAVIGQDLAPIVAAGEAIGAALEHGGKVLVFGNGGSAAEAQHFAAELVGRFARERRGLPSIALTTDTSVLTAIANDYGYDRVFARQVEALGEPGDVAIGISTSGHSPNVLAALGEARARRLTTIGMTGRDGGVIKSAVDININVPHPTTARIQEVQLMVLHILCDLAERRFV